MRVELDGRLEAPRRFAGVPCAHGIDADGILEKREDAVGARRVGRGIEGGDLLLQLVGFLPLLLLLVQLLQVHQRVAVAGIEPQHLLERLVRAIDEAAAAEVQAEAEQHVRVLEAREPRPLQQRLVHVDGAAHLSLLAIEVAENHVDLERVGVESRGLGQLVDGEIDLP